MGAPFEDSPATGAFPANADPAVFADAPPGESENSGAVHLCGLVDNPLLPNRVLTDLKPQAGSVAAANGARLGSSLACSRRVLGATPRPAPRRCTSAWTAGDRARGAGSNRSRRPRHPSSIVSA